MRGRKPATIDSTDAITRVSAAPTWLSVSAKKEWRRVMPILVARRILTHADLGSLENYCIATGRVRDLERAIQLDGRIDPVLARLQDKAMSSARQLAAELGLTPVSRSRPSTRGERDLGEDNPLAA
ncbi:MAG: phage terminase small subunit P27 family [Hyphomicrobiaceae bacterium]